MTRYKIIDSTGLHSLSEKVEEFLNDGWICQGGVSSHFIHVKDDGLEYVHTQAIIKHEIQLKS